jgi:hypothetical protein
MPDSVFGPTRHPGELERAVEQALRKWMPTYVKRMEAVGDKKLAPIKSFSIVSDYAKFPELALPALVIESAGLVEGTLEEDGEGNLSGTFSVSVFSMIQGKDAVATRDLAFGYWWPIAASLMQHRKIGEDIWVQSFIDSGFAGANVDQRRTRIGVEHVFYVTLDNFLNVGEGPLEPDPEAASDEWATVETVETEVEKEN